MNDFQILRKEMPDFAKQLCKNLKHENTTFINKLPQFLDVLKSKFGDDFVVTYFKNETIKKKFICALIELSIKISHPSQSQRNSLVKMLKETSDNLRQIQQHSLYGRWVEENDKPAIQQLIDSFEARLNLIKKSWISGGNRKTTILELEAVSNMNDFYFTMITKSKKPLISAAKLTSIASEIVGNPMKVGSVNNKASRYRNEIRKIIKKNPRKN